MRNDKKRNVPQYNPCPTLECDTQAVEALVHQLDLDGRWPIPDGELSLAFLPQDQHCQLHEDFLDDPTPTDVITFEGDPDEQLAGEICVSVDTAWEYAHEHGLNFSEELSLYLVHGYLHLAGFDDLNEADRAIMKQQEALCMEMLKKAGKVPHFKYNPTNV